MNWLTKLERKYGRFAIHNLMWYVIALNITGFLIIAWSPELASYLPMSVELILKGQVWRLFTFILIPPTGSLIGMFFFAMFYYWMGTGLEQVWGAFRFNVYLIMGVLLHVVAAFLVYFIFGYDLMLNLTYLNISLFLAFGAEFPDYTILIMFILPVKMKYLAAVSAIFLGFEILGGIMPFLAGSSQASAYQLASSIGALIAIGNFIIYYVSTNRVSPRQKARQQKMRANLKKAETVSKVQTRHKCAVCGRTEETDPELEFRYCSKCQGAYEYCSDHLYTHVHVNHSAD